MVRDVADALRVAKDAKWKLGKNIAEGFGGFLISVGVEYGTKENPMPIFWKRTLSDYNSEMEYVATVSDAANKIFVGKYLFRFLPKKEFKRLYGDSSE